MSNPFTKFLWKHRKKNIAIAFIYFVLAVAFVFGVMDKYYTANVSLLPPAGSSALQGRLNTIASLMGMGSPGNSILSLEMFESIIHSRKLEKQLLNTAFTVPVNGQSQTKTLLEFLEIEGDNDRELYQKAYKQLNEEVIYTEVDEITNMMILNVTLKNPFLAAAVANKIVVYLDSLVKQHLTREFQQQYAYLKKRINTVQDSINITEQKLKRFLEKSVDVTTPEHIVERMRLEREMIVLSTVFSELKKQEELFIMQNIYMLSPVKVLDMAEVPYRKSRPKRLLVLVALLILGGAFQLMVNAGIVFYKRFKSEVLPSLDDRNPE